MTLGKESCTERLPLYRFPLGSGPSRAGNHDFNHLSPGPRGRCGLRLPLPSVWDFPLSVATPFVERAIPVGRAIPAKPARPIRRALGPQHSLVMDPGDGNELQEFGGPLPPLSAAVLLPGCPSRFDARPDASHRPGLPNPGAGHSRGSARRACGGHPWGKNSESLPI